jgi:hypothetical protein
MAHKMIKSPLSLIVSLTVLFTFSSLAFAFPELARHGYVNCTSCHVSPSGGGVLTPYGRQLSKDLLSTWSRESEPEFAYGFVKTPEWLNIGGDGRAIEIYRNTPQVEAYRLLLMQADAEASATIGKFTADVRFGEYMNFDSPQSRQFYVNYRPREELSIRVGKFQTAFGLMEPDHRTPIRHGLGWDEGTESYNVEAAWLAENFNVYLTGDFGPLDSKIIPDANKEKGAALRIGVPFKDSYQAGVSYFHGKSDSATRDVAGPFGILGFTHKLFLLTEADLQNVYNGSANKTGVLAWNKLDYEIIQGLHGYAIYELSQSDFSSGARKSSAIGFGSQFFPRPHLEFDFLWKFETSPAFPSDILNQATLLMHYYL